MADLDYFKRLNDTYGHAAGDAVLRAFAEQVRETLRQSDLVCRYGGEEFAFLFPEISPDETARLAERLRVACVAHAVPLPDGRSVTATVSIGLADASECRSKSPSKCRRSPVRSQAAGAQLGGDRRAAACHKSDTRKSLIARRPPVKIAG